MSESSFVRTRTHSRRAPERGASEAFRTGRSTTPSKSVYADNGQWYVKNLVSDAYMKGQQAMQQAKLAAKAEAQKKESD